MKIIDFMRWKWLNLGISALLAIGSLVSLTTKSLNFGLDFTGGIVIELAYKNPVNLENVRSSLTQAGYNEAVVQFFGQSTDILVRMPPQNGDQAVVAKKLSETLSADQNNPVEVRRVEFVGPQVGDELRDQSGIALIVALFGIFVYVVLRFDFKFAVGAIISLIHDVIITAGVFSFWQIPFDLTVLAAILALIGYSINDTIVVYDRIRENFRSMRKSEPVEVFNFAMTSTLGRTTITSGVTQLVVVALFFFGGEVIHGFALALLIGITIGTYSSIFIASALALILGVTKEHFIVEKKEEFVDDRP